MKVKLFWDMKSYQFVPIHHTAKHKSLWKLPSGHTSKDLLWHRPGPIFLHGVAFLTRLCL